MAIVGPNRVIFVEVTTTSSRSAAAAPSSLRPLAERRDCWHKFRDVVVFLFNLQACHAKNEDGEGQLQLLCTRDRIIDRLNKLFHFLLSRHHYVSAERLEMKKSRFAEFLQSDEGGSVSLETVDSLRLLKMFVKLTPAQRREIIELVERYLQH
jgi:hypothetical protein